MEHVVIWSDVRLAKQVCARCTRGIAMFSATRRNNYQQAGVYMD